MDITFRIITLKELKQFTSSEYFACLPEIPVTIHRAESLALNPRASADDLAVLLACDEKGNMLGYWGFLSDYLSGSPGEKIMWNSGWRVVPGASHAAMPLLYKALKICGNNILYSDLTPHTRQILEATGKTSIHERTGMRWYIRPCSADIIVSRKPSLKFLKPLLLAADAFAALFAHKQKPELPGGITISECGILERDDMQFIESTDTASLSRRSVAELNWIKQNPWIIPVEKDNAQNKKRYYFSSSEKKFSTHFYRIQQNRSTIAIAMLNNRNGHLTLPYYMCSKDSKADAANALTYIIASFRAKTFTTFNPLFLDTNENIACLHTRNLTRYFAYGNKTNISYSPTLLIQDGDGDCAFT